MPDFPTCNYSADVLIIGGGLSGLSAAIEAAGKQASVIVLEKANTLRSGLAGSGIDHIQSYIPEFHEKIGYTTEDLTNDQYEFGGNLGGLRNIELARYFAEHSAADIRQLEHYGLQFKFYQQSTDGLGQNTGQAVGSEAGHAAAQAVATGLGHLKTCGYKIVPQFHFVPTSYNFGGRDIKRVLTAEAIKAGVQIINRVHVRKLVVENGQAVGAVGISTRSHEIITVRAKTTILATQGGITRLSTGFAQGASFESFSTPTASAGAGKVLAIDAGARVLNLELTNLVDGYALLNYSFSVGLPSGSWWPAGRIVDEDGNVVVPRNHDIAEDTPNYKQRYRELVDFYYEGRGKISELLAQGKRLYFDLQEATPKELENIWWALGHEGKTNVLRDHLANNKIDFHKARFPLRIAGKGTPVPSGIFVKDDTTETDVANLYATGDEIAGTGSGIPVAGGALVFGRRSGEQAVLRASQIVLPEVDFSEAVSELSVQVESLLAENSKASTWKDAETALQALADDTLGKPYTATSVQDDMAILKAATNDLKIKAANPHELSRSFETLDLYRVLGFIYQAILARTSSLGPYLRADEGNYPAIPYGSAIAVTNKDGKLTTETVSFT